MEVGTEEIIYASPELLIELNLCNTNGADEIQSDTMP